jgi:hypothetical protein
MMACMARRNCLWCRPFYGLAALGWTWPILHPANGLCSVQPFMLVKWYRFLDGDDIQRLL